MTPLVCAILINYNGYSDTRDCIDSLKKCNYPNIKIIIVDNASLHGAVQYDEIITRDCCEIIYLKENIGFAGGNNVGFKCAQKYAPDYYLVLNNDTVVTPGFLQPLINCFEIDSRVGIATGKILYYSDNDILWYGGCYYDKKLGEYKIRGIGEKDSDLYNQKCKVEFATGCLWLISSKVLQQVGKMDEDYFLYYEDADYCERIRNEGYSIYYLPESIIFHKESKSTGKGSDIYQYYNNRNYLMYIKKYRKTRRLYFYIRRVIRMLKGTFRGRIKVQITVKVWRDFLQNKSGKISDPL